MLTEHIISTLVDAEGKALGTTGPHGVNVVPVSGLKVTDDTVVLFDFFMHKTIENLQAEPEISLAAWIGFKGIQLKATAEYLDEGPLFEDAVERMKTDFPDRTLDGIILLRPHTVYDISTGPNAGTLLASTEGEHARPHAA